MISSVIVWVTMARTAQPWPLWIGSALLSLLVQLVCQVATGIATHYEKGRGCC